MTAKRTRISRRFEGPTPSELEWLTGEPQEGANRFWKLSRSAEKVARCRAPMENYTHLIPRGRLSVLERNLAFWMPRPQG